MSEKVPLSGNTSAGVDKIAFNLSRGILGQLINYFSGFLAPKFLEFERENVCWSCQNCYRSVQRNIWKTTVKMLKFLGTLREKFVMVVKTAFCVSRGTFWGYKK